MVTVVEQCECSSSHRTEHLRRWISHVFDHYFSTHSVLQLPYPRFTCSVVTEPLHHLGQLTETTLLLARFCVWP